MRRGGGVRRGREEGKKREGEGERDGKRKRWEEKEMGETSVVRRCAV